MRQEPLCNLPVDLPQTHPKPARRRRQDFTADLGNRDMCRHGVSQRLGEKLRTQWIDVGLNVDPAHDRAHERVQARQRLAGGEVQLLLDPGQFDALIQLVDIQQLDVLEPDQRPAAGVGHPAVGQDAHLAREGVSQ